MQPAGAEQPPQDDSQHLFLRLAMRARRRSRKLGLSQPQELSQEDLQLVVQVLQLLQESHLDLREKSGVPHSGLQRSALHLQLVLQPVLQLVLQPVLQLVLQPQSEDARRARQRSRRLALSQVLQELVQQELVLPQQPLSLWPTRMTVGDGAATGSAPVIQVDVRIRNAFTGPTSRGNSDAKRVASSAGAAHATRAVTPTTLRLDSSPRSAPTDPDRNRGFSFHRRLIAEPSQRLKKKTYAQRKFHRSVLTGSEDSMAVTLPVIATI